jgi:hypothetical protein
MDGAFNDVALQLSPGANESEVIERLDALLNPARRALDLT